MEYTGRYGIQISEKTFHFVQFTSDERNFVNKHLALNIDDLVVECDDDDNDPSICFKCLKRDSGYVYIIRTKGRYEALEIMNLISRKILDDKLSIESV
jgi:hypothetical protein